MTSSDRLNSRRKLYAQLAIVLVVIAFALLKPRIEPWLDQNFPAPADDGRPALELGNTGAAGGRVPPVVPTLEHREEHEPTAVVVPDVAARNSQSLDVDAVEGASPEVSVPDRRTGASGSRESGDEPPPGQLKLIGRNVFRSTAGLVYRPGSREGHRLKHILKHATVNMQERIGYTGGQRGKSGRKSECRYLRLVLEDDGETVVTAYPVSSF